MSSEKDLPGKIDWYIDKDIVTKHFPNLMKSKGGSGFTSETLPDDVLILITTGLMDFLIIHNYSPEDRKILKEIGQAEIDILLLEKAVPPQFQKEYEVMHEDLRSIDIKIPSYFNRIDTIEEFIHQLAEDSHSEE